MSLDPSLPPRISRRTALLWTGAVAAMFAAGEGCAPAGVAPVPTAEGYGRDPNLNEPKKEYWPRVMTPGQLAATAALVDFILPAEGSAPAASALGVHEFIDEWVSAPYPDQVADRKLISDGLAWMEKDLQAHGAATFAKAPDAAKEATLTALAGPPGAAPPPAGFFAKVRKLTIGAYYTTHEGFKDLGYIGNQSLPAYPPASAEVRAALDKAYVTLKI